MARGRRPTPGVPRPPCPQGHHGRIWLDGRRTSRDGRFERTRYRCLPADPLEKPHAFLAPVPGRRECGHEAACETCDRPFGRADGLAGAWRFSFVLREAATTLVRAGRGTSYRKISAAIRASIGRTSARGHGAGRPSRSPDLALDYLDVFGPPVIAATTPRSWPRIVALDAHPIRIADHTLCCGQRQASRRKIGDARAAHGERRTDHASDRKWYPPDDDELPMIFPAWETGTLGATLDDLPDELREQADAALAQWGERDREQKADGALRRLKIKHSPEVVEIGRILVAVGYEKAGDRPRPWLMRFMGSGDQVSWTEFLHSLAGEPEWVVSDRDAAIAGAVAEVWPQAVHYHCEQHIAENMADAARADGISEPGDPIWPILEDAQFGEREWAAAEGAAQARGAEKLLDWLLANRALPLEQLAKRESHKLYPRSAGACEDTIGELTPKIEGREQRFRNADRLDLLLALIRNELDGSASVAAYVKVIRGLLDEHGRSNADWWSRRDQKGVSSMRELWADAQERGKAATTRRRAPYKAEAYRRRKERWAAARKARGLPEAPHGRPRILRAQGSVAGKMASDFWWLEIEWHPTKNAGLSPDTMPAGSGELVWWTCRDDPEHVWQAQVRSRTIRGTRCPFCMGRRTAPHQSLAATFPDLAAQWHPTRNGTKTAADFSFGSHHEAWWQCSRHKGHVWKSRIASRTAMATGCPLCARLEGRGGRPRADAEEHAIA